MITDPLHGAGDRHVPRRVEEARQVRQRVEQGRVGAGDSDAGRTGRRVLEHVGCLKQHGGDLRRLDADADPEERTLGGGRRHLADDGQVELGDQELARGVVEHPVTGHRPLAALDDEAQGRHGDTRARRGRRVGRGDRQPLDRGRPVAVVGVAADQPPQRFQS
jgi:hypothetical protein